MFVRAQMDNEQFSLSYSTKCLKMYTRCGKWILETSNQQQALPACSQRGSLFFIIKTVILFCKDGSLGQLHTHTHLRWLKVLTTHVDFILMFATGRTTRTEQQQ
jgi:hypothetical protein